MSEDSVLAYKTNNKLYQNTCTCIDKICLTYIYNYALQYSKSYMSFNQSRKCKSRINFFPSIYDIHTIDTGVLTYSGGWRGDVLSEEIFEVAFIQYNSVATCV